MLLPEHIRHLRETSGLTDDTVEKLNISSVVDPQAIASELGVAPGRPLPPVPGIRFPYPQTDYVRYRPDKPRRGNSDRPVKYEAIRDRSPRMYIPLPIAPAIADTSQPIYLTEGEKKAAVASQAGLPAIAAPGIHLFHDVDARRSDDLSEWRLHPDLHPYIVPGRKTTIVFDSDVDANPAVTGAAVRLARMLARHGALAYITYLPSTDGRKVGLDDLYVSLGCDGPKLLAVIEESTRPADPFLGLRWLAARWSA
jgi:hypothetical protein